MSDTIRRSSRKRTVNKWYADEGDISRTPPGAEATTCKTPSPKKARKTISDASTSAEKPSEMKKEITIAPKLEKATRGSTVKQESSVASSGVKTSSDDENDDKSASPLGELSVKKATTSRSVRASPRSKRKKLETDDDSLSKMESVSNSGNDNENDDKPTLRIGDSGMKKKTIPRSVRATQGSKRKLVEDGILTSDMRTGSDDKKETESSPICKSSMKKETTARFTRRKLVQDDDSTDANGTKTRIDAVNDDKLVLEMKGDSLEEPSEGDNVGKAEATAYDATAAATSASTEHAAIATTLKPTDKVVIETMLESAGEAAMATTLLSTVDTALATTLQPINETAISARMESTDHTDDVKAFQSADDTDIATTLQSVDEVSVATTSQLADDAVIATTCQLVNDAAVAGRVESTDHADDVKAFQSDDDAAIATALQLDDDAVMETDLQSVDESAIATTLQPADDTDIATTLLSADDTDKATALQSVDDATVAERVESTDNANVATTLQLDDDAVMETGLQAIGDAAIATTLLSSDEAVIATTLDSAEYSALATPTLQLTANEVMETNLEPADEAAKTTYVRPAHDATTVPALDSTDDSKEIEKTVTSLCEVTSQENLAGSDLNYESQARIQSATTSKYYNDGPGRLSSEDTAHGSAAIPSSSVDASEGESAADMADSHQMTHVGEQKRSSRRVKAPDLPSYDDEEHRVRRCMPRSLPRRRNDVYVTQKTNFQCQVERCRKMFAAGFSTLYIHGLGLAVNRAINLALLLKAELNDALELGVHTSTLQLTDELVPLTEEAKPDSRTRVNSAVHIRVSVPKCTANTSKS